MTRANADTSPTYQRLAALAERPAPLMTQAPRFGLLVPPSPFVVPRGWEWVHSAPFEGPSIIAALVRAMGLPFTMLDQRAAPDPAACAAALDAPGGIDLLGVATYEDSFPYQRAAIALAKRLRPERPVILGGPTVTSLPEVYLANTAADYAVLGEGELTLIELLDYLLGRPAALRLEQIAGLAYKDQDGRVRVNAPRPQMLDLDPVPLQDLSVWPSVAASGQAPEIYMTYSRGCPCSCSFCFRAMPHLAYKSPARLRAELEHLRRYAYRMAWWSDLTFTAERERVLGYLQAMAGLDFRWCSFTRVDAVDRELLAAMRARGCDLVMYGFESITPAILAAYHKRTAPDQMVAAIEATRQAGVKVGGLFIVGAPGETEASLAAMVDFCRQFREVTRVKYLSLLPGTALYRWALASGLIRDEVAHLEFLARERSQADDQIVNVCGLPEQLLRDTYRTINGLIEQRPYEYWNPVNRFLDAPQAFAGRPLPGGESDPAAAPAYKSSRPG